MGSVYLAVEVLGSVGKSIANHALRNEKAAKLSQVCERSLYLFSIHPFILLSLRIIFKAHKEKKGVCFLFFLFLPHCNITPSCQTR